MNDAINFAELKKVLQRRLMKELLRACKKPLSKRQKERKRIHIESKFRHIQLEILIKTLKDTLHQVVAHHRGYCGAESHVSGVNDR